MTSQTSDGSGVPAGLMAALFLVIFAGLVVPIMATLSATGDEPRYLNAGHTIREQGWVTKNTLMQGPIPFYSNQLFIDEFPAEPVIRTNLDQELLFRGRLGMLPFAILVGILVFVWAGQVFGSAGGLLALCCYVTNPLMIGYGALLAVDMAYSAGTLLTLFFLWRFLLQPSAGRAVILGMGLGTALATKYLTLLIVPVILLSAAVRIRRPGPAIAIALTIGVTALITLHAWYGFSPGFARSDPSAYSSDLLSTLVEMPVVGWILVLLPEPFLAGVDFQLHMNQGWTGSYLNGRFAAGHWSYYIWSFLLKTPEWTILLGCWVLYRHLGRLFRKGTERERALAWAIVPSAAVLMIYLSFFAKLQIGVRYMLPMFPMLFILLGASLHEPWIRRSPRWVLVIMASLLLTVQAWDLGGQWPNLIAYYNTSAGGQAQGYKYFLDSNSDWHQLDEPGRALLEQSEGEELEIVVGNQGPRFGRIGIYLDHLRKRDPEDLSRSHHWLDPFTAVRNLGAAWWVFEVTPERWEHILLESDDPRSRAELALAYLASGQDTDFLRHLSQLPAHYANDLRGLRQCLAQLDDPEENPDLVLRAIGYWAKLGRFDQAHALLLEHEVPNEAVISAHVLAELGRFEEAISILSNLADQSPAVILLIADYYHNLNKRGEALSLLEQHEQSFTSEQKQVAEAIRNRMR